MTKSKSLQPNPEVLEITWDFDRADLMDLLEVIEWSMSLNDAKAHQKFDTALFGKFLRVVRTCFVSSSRPLTRLDYQALAADFWKHVKLVQDPKA